MGESTARDEHGRDRIFGSERAKAFIDAVVAIAMTLLILPLMESIGDASTDSTDEWFGEHWWQLVSFVLSFAIIAMFWINHHRLFARVEQVTIPLLWISMAWLLTIVWLPVATAMSGRISDEDPRVKIVYIGSMILTSLVTLGQRLYLQANPELHGIAPRELRHGVAVDISMALLFGVALVVAVLVPIVGYYALFVMFLTGPAQNVIAKLIGAERLPDERPATEGPSAQGLPAE